MSKNKSKKPKVPIEKREPRPLIPLKNEPAVYLVRATLWIGCFVLFAPLFLGYAYYSPHVFLKSILFRLAVQVMLFLYVILALISPAHRPRFHRLTWSLLAWFAVMLLCSVPGISTNAWKSWLGDFTRMDGMFTQVHVLAYFFVLIQTFKRERDWLTMLTASLLSGVFMGLTGLTQMTSAGEPARIEGATGNPDFFGSFMLLNLCIGLYFLLRKDREKLYPDLAKVWLVLLMAADAGAVVWNAIAGGQVLSASLDSAPLIIFAVVLHCVTLLWFWMRQSARAGTVFLGILCLYSFYWLYQSQTRAAAVGLAAGLAFTALLYLWKGRDKRLKWAAALLLVLFVAVPFFLFSSRDSGWVQNSPILRRLTSTSFTERRFIAWEAGVKGIMDRPVLGWGLEHYRKSFDLHAPVRLFQGPNAENWDDRAHNIILDVGTTTGIAGLAAFLAFYAFVFLFLLRAWFKDRSATAFLAISGVLAAYLVQNLFIFDTVNTNGIVFLVLGYVAYLYGKDGSDPAEIQNLPQARRSLSSSGYIVLAAAAVLLICAFHYTVSEPRRSNLSLNYAVALGNKAGSQNGTPSMRESVITEFQRAEGYNTTGRHQVREEFANYAVTLATKVDIPLEERARAAEKAVELMGKSVLEDPFDARHYMYSASLANGVFEVLDQSDPQRARSLAERNLELLQKAEALGPNRPRLFVERAQLLLSLNRIDEGLAALRKAIRLDPDNRAMKVDLVATCISVERYEEAEKEWQKIKPPRGRSVYETVIGFYIMKRQIAPVIALYQEQLREMPDDPVVLAHLATAYREAGEIESARRTALKAAKLSPQVAEQVQDFLKTLVEK